MLEKSELIMRPSILLLSSDQTPWQGWHLLSQTGPGDMKKEQLAASPCCTVQVRVSALRQS